VAEDARQRVDDGSGWVRRPGLIDIAAPANVRWRKTRGAGLVTTIAAQPGEQPLCLGGREHRHRHGMLHRQARLLHFWWFYDNQHSPTTGWW
jgi:hypothetical protein